MKRIDNKWRSIEEMKIREKRRVEIETIGSMKEKKKKKQRDSNTREKVFCL